MNFIICKLHLNILKIEKKQQVKLSDSFSNPVVVSLSEECDWVKNEVRLRSSGNSS